MISVTEYNGSLSISRQTFICICGKVHHWRPTTQQSPYTCLGGCNSIMPDVTKLILEAEWRVAYHLGGRKAVKCGVSL